MGWETKSVKAGIKFSHINLLIDNYKCVRFDIGIQNTHIRHEVLVEIY